MNSRTASLLAAVGAGLTAAALIGAPLALAEEPIACAPDQIVLDGNCVPAPVEPAIANPNMDFAPNAGGDPFSGVEPGSGVDLGHGGVDVATGGVDIGGGGVDLATP
ncbi:hypothetical protein [Mycobacterium sp. URHB0044]|uniref:hypothetical protein n=1 Tax=Mycobacterium sp. URHB0044 TaxID=1380386 RepID=UPI00048D9CE1|nr:hypothetical protein [Mycobacterium sp. URHB0044]